MSIPDSDFTPVTPENSDQTIQPTIISASEFLNSIKISYCGEDCNSQAQSQQVETQAQQAQQVEENPFPKWATWVAYIVTLLIIIKLIQSYTTKKRNVKEDYEEAVSDYSEFITPNITYIIGGLHFLHIENFKKYVMWLYDPKNLF
jgi:hypothetical protein